MCRIRTDFEALEDLQAAGLSEEQGKTLIRATYEMQSVHADRGDLHEASLKIEEDLKAAGFSQEMAQAIVRLSTAKL